MASKQGRIGVLGLVLLALEGCASGPVSKVVLTDPDLLDQDRVVVCGYLRDRLTLVCMSPEEYAVRSRPTGE